jgi:hypothetical protein
MLRRKTILIPLVSMDDNKMRQFLEVIVDPGPVGSPDFKQLAIHGLEPAITIARTALARFKLPLGIRGPVLYPAIPIPGLSNAAGATLGVTIGLLMYYGLCPGERILATGGLHVPQDGEKQIKVINSSALDVKLTAALSLTKQSRPLPFIFPANSESEHIMDSLSSSLHKLNICPTPVTSLHQAITACRDITCGDNDA